MGDPLDDVLRLVADGRLTPQEAAPIIDALAAGRGSGRRNADAGRPSGSGSPAGGPSGGSSAAGRQSTGSPGRVRIEVRDGGRTVIDLQVPGVLAELASSLPGIPAAYAEQVRSAMRTGLRGRIVDVQDEDGDGITISVD